MTTETTEPSAAAAEPTGWRAAQQLATNATWQVSGITAVAPFCVTQNDVDGGVYTGAVHYHLLAPLREIAEAYDVTVIESPSAGGGTAYRVVALVDGTSVTCWAVNPTDAPTAQTGGAA